jgi:hypothetical protein
VIGDMTPPISHMTVPGGKAPDTIEVAFDPKVPVDPNTIIAMKTFIVQGGLVVTPKIVMMSNNVVRFHSARPLGMVTYQVTLLDQILDAAKRTNLDGEFPKAVPPNQPKWPSGDGVPGGNFQFELTISG